MLRNLTRARYLCFRKLWRINLNTYLNVYSSESFFLLKGNSAIRFSYWNDNSKDKNFKGQKQPPEVSVRKGLLRNFTKFTGKHLYQSLFCSLLIRPKVWLNCQKRNVKFVSATLLKERLWHRCFPVNFVKFLRTPILQNTSERCSVKKVGLNTSRMKVFLDNTYNTAISILLEMQRFH